MNESAWLIAAVPEPVVCCRVELLPLCAGHLMLMRRFGSAFVTGGIPTMDDLFISVWVCQRNYDDGCKFRWDDDMVTYCKSWGAELALGRKRFLRGREKVTFNFVAAIDRFATYLSAGGWGYGAEKVLPVCLPKKNSEGLGNVGTSTELMHIVALMTDLGMTYSEAVNMPFVMGRHLLAANAERSGAISVIPLEEFAAMKAHLQPKESNG